MEKPSRHVSSYREALYLNAEDQVSVSFPIQFGLSHSGVVSGPWRCDALFDLQLLFREDFQVPKEIQMSISDESQEQEFRILTDPKKNLWTCHRHAVLFGKMAALVALDGADFQILVHSKSRLPVGQGHLL